MFDAGANSCFLSVKNPSSLRPSSVEIVSERFEDFGFDVTNDIFAKNDWYFRNAMVRANYNDLKNGIHETTEYLELFLRNLLLDEKHELHNREMHISGKLVQSANSNISKCQNGTLKFTIDELSIIKILLSDSKVTQKKIAELTGLSERTVKRKTVEMQQKGFIIRENGKRNGKWIVLIDAEEI